MERLEELAVEPCKVVGAGSICFLLIGPIGAGKSRFIECLAGSASLQISSGQLDQGTQEVRAYKVISPQVDIPDVRSIYLIDTPGFSSPDHADSEVFSQVEKFMIDKHIPGIHHILYFQPMTEVRMRNHQIRHIVMIRSLLEKSEFPMRQFTIVTTMWDMVVSETHRARAEGNYYQYEDHMWMEMIREGARRSRHLNTQQSAWSNLSAAVDQVLYVGLTASEISKHALTPEQIFIDMIQQLQMGLAKQEAYREQRRQLFTNPNKRLEAVIIPAVKKGDEDLKRMGELLQAFSPPGFAGVQLQNRQTNYLLLEAEKDVQAIQAALAECGPRTDTSSLKNQIKEAQENRRQYRGVTKPNKRLEAVIIPAVQKGDEDLTRRGKLLQAIKRRFRHINISRRNRNLV